MSHVTIITSKKIYRTKYSFIYILKLFKILQILRVSGTNFLHNLHRLSLVSNFLSSLKDERVFACCSSWGRIDQIFGPKYFTESNQL